MSLLHGSEAETEGVEGAEGERGLGWAVEVWDGLESAKIALAYIQAHRIAKQVIEANGGSDYQEHGAVKNNTTPSLGMLQNAQIPRAVIATDSS